MVEYHPLWSGQLSQGAVMANEGREEECHGTLFPSAPQLTPLLLYYYNTTPGIRLELEIGNGGDLARLAFETVMA